MRKKSLSVLMATTTGALFASVITAQQASAADLILGANAYTADTSALTITGPSLSVHGIDVSGVAVFRFNTVSVPSGASITATGSRPFELQAVNSMIIGGLIQSNGTDATTFTNGPFAGGAGGAAGGTGVFSATGFTAGHGPGGGHVASDKFNGGGGGGFGGKGARGGLCNSGTCPGEAGTVGGGGAVYGNLNVKLQGGSGGAAGSSVGGGGGGGAIGLFASSVTLQNTAVVLANGGNGNEGGFGASGGGSGGGIVIHANNVSLDGVVEAVGGAGGGGGCCGDGGAGGGGRIAVQYKSLQTHNVLTVVIAGGSSGTSGGSHGGQSIDTTGANGLITYAQIDASKLTIGANKSITKGQTTTVATKLTDAGTGVGIGKALVSLWKKPASGGSWTKVATKTTSSGGSASASVKPSASTIYQWRFDGTLIHLKTTSPNETITVH